MHIMTTKHVVEQWRDIPSYEGLYQVSDFGRVRSFKCTRKGKILRLHATDEGYQRVTLRKRVKNKTHRVHRLVFLTFKGRIPEGLYVCHNDGNPSNNKLDNLRTDTPSGNQADRIKHGTSNRGEKHYRTKLTEEQVIAIRELLENTDITQTNIGKTYGVASDTISDIHRRITWKHI